MDDMQIPRTAEALMKYLDQVREAYRVVREFEAWRAKVPSLPVVSDRQSGPEASGKGGIGIYVGARLGEAVLTVLQASPDQVFRAKEVMAVLRDGGMTFTSARPDLSISRCLSRAMKDGRVIKKGRGLWQWKPNSPPEKLECGMCDRDAMGQMGENGVWTISCDGCGEYEITAQALASIEEGMDLGDLQAVRDTVRSKAEAGERPAVTTKTMRDWARRARPVTEPDDDLPF